MNEVLGLRGSMCGCQYPKQVTDMPDFFGLADGEFVGGKELQMASTIPEADAPFDKAQSNFRQLKRFMQYKALDGAF